MKGFIEVTLESNNKKYSINIEKINDFGLCGINRYVNISLNSSQVKVKESYEEIKELIKIAQS